MNKTIRFKRALQVVALLGAGTTLMVGACAEQTPASPSPPGELVTATAYILPGAVDLGPNAFGDEPVVVHKGERLVWRNADAVTHNVVADQPALPEFATTGTLAPGDEHAVIMNSAGTTGIHCTIHPQMTGILVVRPN